MSMIQTGVFNLDSTHPTAVASGNTSTFTEVHFPTPFPRNAKVVVIPMVQTFNGRDTPGLRIADVTSSGFKIRMNEIVSNTGALSDGTHVAETIGWVAFTA